MNFSVLPPEVNSALVFSGPGSGPMLAAAAAWDGIGAELSSAAKTFSSVTSDLAIESWQGPASVSMADATIPYAGWLAKAAAQADQSASQARAAAAAFEDALTAMVDPGLVSANRAFFISLVNSNLFGLQAPAIAAAEAAYEQMWAQAVSAMAGYHTSSSAAVAQLASWEQALENVPGPPGHIAWTIANTSAVVQQEVQHTVAAVPRATSQVANNVATFISGSPAGPAIPASQNPNYTGTPSLTTRIELGGLDAVKNISGLFGIDAYGQLAVAIQSTSPPKILTLLLGETVQHTTYDGMSVVQITPADPSGKYVVAVHGGAWVVQPSILNWLNYTMMANQTGATIEVPLYPLATAPNGAGTAAMVVPEIAGFISSQTSAHPGMVSVTGDSAGGSIALSALQLMVADPATYPVLPTSMVLISPGLDASFSNPNIALANDPILNVNTVKPDGQLWAGNLPLNDPLVSPLYGSLQGLPPTYVYSGSNEILAPDTLLLVQKAAVQDPTMSFVLRSGEVHDWALGGLGDGSRYNQQIYSELGI